MPGVRFRNGPWPGGLNRMGSEDEASEIADNQLAECLNFNVDNNGNLTGRQGVRLAQALDFTTYSTTATNSITALGSVLDVDGNQYALVGVNNSPTTATTRFYYTTDGTWSPITLVGGQLVRTTTNYSKAVKFRGAVYFVPYLGAGGFSLDRISEAAAYPVVTEVAAIPAGDDAFIFQDRMWVVNPATNTLYWSKATDATTWAAPDGGAILISPGDGQTIRRVVVLGATMIIFKEQSTYLLTYTTDPALDVYVRPASPNMGAFDAITHEGNVYLINGRGIYQFINNQFLEMSRNLHFDIFMPDTVTNRDAAINIVGNYLIAGIARTGFCLNMANGAWSRHSYEINMGPQHRGIVGRKASGSGATHNIFFVNGRYVSVINVEYPQRLYDNDTAGLVISPQYQARTKTFEFGDRDNWKRLYWWNIKGQVFTAAVDTNPNAIINPSSLLISTSLLDSMTDPYTNQRFKRKIGPSLRFQRLQLEYNKPRTVMAGVVATTSAYFNITEITVYVIEKAVITQQYTDATYG